MTPDDRLLLQEAQRLHAEMDRTFPVFTRQTWRELSSPAQAAFLSRAEVSIKERKASDLFERDV